MCLKAPPLLWLAVLFLSRGVLLPVVMGMGHFIGVDSRALTAFREYWRLDSLAPSLIAAVVLVVLCLRVPSAPALARRIWARGRILLIAAAVLDIALLAIAVFRQGEINDSSLLMLCSVVLDLYLLVYIVAAFRVRHVFSDFPPPLDPPDPG
jgi:hypothetical protein